MLPIATDLEALTPRTHWALQNHALGTKLEFPTTSEPVDKLWKIQNTISHNLTTVIHPLTTGHGADKSGALDACGAIATGLFVFLNQKKMGD